ncbi:hypothetical protein PTTG_29800 [Puccinia triticina 1-1 BBBD Race 1]|uniref:Uncharacterized protein n=1 Tax=Puccinia triticina (isolate 1-1 / race 1 (BBBD)) TaxID=630390 RepID=A0A180G2G5_PUCT1|nr:hypothetical protein PTTG_29800 [Puccinia triticina 1-1 BBBD Race 1]
MEVLRRQALDSHRSLEKLIEFRRPSNRAHIPTTNREPTARQLNQLGELQLSKTWGIHLEDTGGWEEGSNIVKRCTRSYSECPGPYKELISIWTSRPELDVDAKKVFSIFFNKKAITNVSNTCSSLSLQSGSHHKQIKDLLKLITNLTSKVPEKKSSKSCECEFNKLTFKEDLMEIHKSFRAKVENQAHNLTKEVSAIASAKDDKLVNVVQTLRGKIESLSSIINNLDQFQVAHEVQNLSNRVETLAAEITALSHDNGRDGIPTPGDHRSKGNSSREEYEPRGEPSNSNVMLFGILQEIKHLTEAVKSRTATVITEDTFKKLLEELDEAHRKDFSAVSTKLDRLLCQFREDGAEVRAELTVAQEKPVSSWVTRQCRRLKAFEPNLLQQSINF